MVAANIPYSIRHNVFTATINGKCIRRIKIIYDFHLPDDAKIEEEVGLEIKAEIEKKIKELNQPKI